jgi:glycosyltransferase involved in cell wall biosynthesis
MAVGARYRRANSTAMNSNPLVSVIMPAYNAEKYIDQAMKSVLDQDYSNFELLIINDGSTDETESIIQSFSDSRIRLFIQENKGVSSARNLGLDKMKGDFFCFLDADDAMTTKSLSSRIEAFTLKPKLSFVDGKVQMVDEKMENILRIWEPAFSGNPLHDLIGLIGKSFFGPSWIFRKRGLEKIRFDEKLTHCEDLLFCMNCAREGHFYSFVSEVIVRHREHDNSVMFDLVGLDQSYNYVGSVIKQWGEISNRMWRKYQNRTLRIMFLSYLSNKQFMRALKRLIR